MSECNCRECVEAGALEMIRQDGWRMAKTVRRIDETVASSSSLSVPRREWFPFRAVPYGENVYDGKPRETWDWSVMSADDPQEGATSFDSEGEEEAEWLAAVLNNWWAVNTENQHSAEGK